MIDIKSFKKGCEGGGILPEIVEHFVTPPEPWQLTRQQLEAGVVFPIDKPYGWTSADVVRKAKGALRSVGLPKLKIGHAGTLDPLATGILLICVGRATKQAESLQAQAKEYRTTFTLGATTPSYDLEKDVDAHYPYEHITRAEIDRVCGELSGEYDQVPPLFSAKMIDGKRGYEYARKGEEVELRTNHITVYQIEVLRAELPDVELRIACSRGTYVRSMARDFGVLLQSGAHIKALRRTKSGIYDEQSCLSVKDFENIFAFLKQND